ncbi:MAG: hypothetical protein IJQ01_10365 [Selenomonadaceae bacterium]|nr:hypothetical protein [Selenomonadaceae bacterium]
MTYHRRLRRKRNLKSALDNVAGIGSKRRAELFKHFGSLDKIKAATVDELSTVPSMTRAAAQALKEFFDAQSH